MDRLKIFGLLVLIRLLAWQRHSAIKTSAAACAGSRSGCSGTATLASTCSCTPWTSRLTGTPCATPFWPCREPGRRWWQSSSEGELPTANCKPAPTGARQADGRLAPVALPLLEPDGPPLGAGSPGGRCPPLAAFPRRSPAGALFLPPDPRTAVWRALAATLALLAAPSSSPAPRIPAVAPHPDDAET